MSILVVGSVALDTISTPYGKVERALGGSATYFSAAARFFAPVRLVGVVGEDFPEEHVRFLNEHEIDTSGLVRTAGETFHWIGEYGHELGDARTIDTKLGVFAEFRPEVPEHFRDSEVVFLANIDPELQLDVLRQVRNPQIVALDTMNFWIEGKLEALRRVLSEVDVLLINETEAQMLSGERGLIAAARKVCAMGPSTLVIKRGAHGALLIIDDELFCSPAFLLDEVHDPTGAGDTFAGGFVGYLARAGSLNSRTARQAVVAGSVMASFNVQSFSLERLGALEQGEVLRRLEEFGRLTAYEPLALD
ncbi:MAG: PfkB family carbohydrate kinase [Candidatus Alcyoniella australis]|nr:PfkB family carbohydrate kinase [Candidatus Alcyoniella australis]